MTARCWLMVSDTLLPLKKLGILCGHGSNALCDAPEFCSAHVPPKLRDRSHNAPPQLLDTSVASRFRFRQKTHRRRRLIRRHKKFQVRVDAKCRRRDTCAQRSLSVDAHAEFAASF